ncbi:ATP-dependent endonuclease [Sporosarcina sp. P18a]|uniref:ATP-dependent nuclease n=1 Tax=Sporosarcina sp. P18a TaxID=2048259 RepID=UPI000C166A88|nr:AAA family ATPase [Sporosarcina sp. P18a]PIC80707.1 ATP-dependent endonuclease [Sporosarcina sp. P18a]
MYLSELRIWNFRKYGLKEKDNEICPGLTLQFNKGFNLLVGENDSGKTAIVDAIKYTLLTQSYDYIRLEQEDFHLPQGLDESERASEMRIECVFRGFTNDEAKNFLEWLGMEKIDDEFQYLLKVFLVAKRKGRNIFYDIKAGPDKEGKLLSGEARNLLRSTYLTPLRDAERELAPRRNSRLSQILDSHESFKDREEDHYLFEVMEKANLRIKKYFEGRNEHEESLEDLQGEKLLKEINQYLGEFSGVKNNLNSNFSISDMKLKTILEKLSLNLLSTKAGLGSHNLLFIAVELLLLKREGYSGLKLALVEEIEAHIHTQAQIRLVEFLQKEATTSNIQLILTTHSPVLASKISLSNLIVCKNENALPMGPFHTELELGDYLFLERFLDSTKANLFFAEGVILVEGDAENLLIPTIAQIIDKPLSKYGVSIVNVGNTAFLRYSRVFKRRNLGEGILDIPVSCITDNDIKPDIYKSVEKDTETKSDLNRIKTIDQRRKEKEERIQGQFVKLFISPEWTLEYDIALGGLQKELFTAVLQAEKIQNSNRYGLTEKKINEVDQTIEKQYEEWTMKGTSTEEKAFYIYHDLMLEKGISKAITAQCLAGILKNADKNEIQSRILGDKYLEYLVNAISYVTVGADKDD